MITKQDKHGVVRLVAFVRGKTLSCITESGRQDKHFPTKAAARKALKRMAIETAEKHSVPLKVEINYGSEAEAAVRKE